MSHSTQMQVDGKVYSWPLLSVIAVLSKEFSFSLDLVSFLGPLQCNKVPILLQHSTTTTRSHLEYRCNIFIIIRTATDLYNYYSALDRLNFRHLEVSETLQHQPFQPLRNHLRV